MAGPAVPAVSEFSRINIVFLVRCLGGASLPHGLYCWSFPFNVTPVCIKTFSAHVELKNGHVVSKSGLFAHER